MSGLLTRTVDRTKTVLGDFFWMDQNRQYFIFTGRSMEKGRPYTSMWWRQEDPTPNTEPNMVKLTIPQPITEEIYYRSCGQIDRHKRCRQESLDIIIWVLNIFRSGSTYIYFRWMWLMSGWHTKALLGRRRSKLISTIIWMKIWYITHRIGSWYGVENRGGGQLLTLMIIISMTRIHCLARSIVIPGVELLYMWPPLRSGGRRSMVLRLNTWFKSSASYY